MCTFEGVGGIFLFPDSTALKRRMEVKRKVKVVNFISHPTKRTNAYTKANGLNFGADTQLFHFGVEILTKKLDFDQFQYGYIMVDILLCQLKIYSFVIFPGSQWTLGCTLPMCGRLQSDNLHWTRSPDMMENTYIVQFEACIQEKL